MGKIKSNKEYAIRITHPDIGSFYFNYDNWGKYIFTSNLSKVKKWKTLSCVKDQVHRIVTNTNSRSGNTNGHFTFFNCDEINIPDKLKHNVRISRKKKFYYVNHLISKEKVKFDEYEMDKVYEPLKEQIIEISKLFKNDTFKDVQFEDDVKNKFKKLTKIINQYKKNQGVVIRHMDTKGNEKVYIDIVDASFNFRTLKLQKLSGVNTSKK